MAQVVVEMSGDEQKLLRSLQNVINKERQYQKTTTKTNRETKKAQSKHIDGLRQTAAGQSKVTQLMDRFGLSMSKTGLAATALTGTIATLWKVTREGMKEFEERGEEVLGRLRLEERPKKTLAQVAAGSTSQEVIADLKALQSAANWVYTHSDMSREQARNVVFKGRSAGLEDQIRNATLLYTSGFSEDAGEAIASYQKVRRSFGEDAASDFLTTFAQSRVAAAYSPGSIDQVLTGTSAVGAVARDVGISQQEIMAGLARVMEVSKSAERGDERMRAFLGVVMRNKEVFSEAKSLEDIVRIAQSDVGFQKTIKGNLVGVEGLNALALGYEEGGIQRVLQKVRAATGREMLVLAQEVRDSDPMNNIIASQRREDRQAETNARRESVNKLMLDRERARRREENKTKTFGSFKQGVDSWYSWGVETAFGQETAARSLAMDAGTLDQYVPALNANTQAIKQSNQSGAARVDQGAQGVE